MQFAATWIGLENTILSEVSQTEKDQCYICTFMWYLKIMKYESVYKIDKRLTDVGKKKHTLFTNGEKSWGGIN